MIVNNKIKKFFAFMLIMVIPAFIFAAGDTREFDYDNVGGNVVGTENPFGPLIKVFQNWITSFAFGSLCTIRFGKDVLTAYMNRDHDPEGMKKAILRFGLVAIFATVGFRVICMGVRSGLITLMQRL